MTAQKINLELGNPHHKDQRVDQTDPGQDHQEIAFGLVSKGGLLPWGGSYPSCETLAGVYSMILGADGWPLRSGWWGACTMMGPAWARPQGNQYQVFCQLLAS